MSKSDAKSFPVFASGTLVGLYLLFKVFLASNIED